jgi:two-component system osmolarity sensor histidine kinase EnvZ
MKVIALLHKLFPKTLLSRFILIIIVPILIGQIIAIFLFYDRHWYNVSHYTSNLLVGEIKALLEDYEHEEHYKRDNVVGDYLILSYQFYKGKQLPKKQAKLSEELEIFKDILTNKVNKANIVSLYDQRKIEIFFPFKDGILKISFAAKLLLNPSTYIFVLWLVFLTLLLLSVSLIFSKNQIKSILELAKAADSFGRDIKRPTSYKPSGALEIRKAGLAFLKMRERINRQITKRIEMLAMISHDLRTPLTRIKLQLELMNDCEEKEDLSQDVEIMKQMLDSYLDFARGESSEQFQQINLYDWVYEFIHTKFTMKQIKFTSSIKDATCYIKAIAFERAISNLINNAIEYSTIIHIALYMKATYLIIDIEDNGAGIKDDDKDLVFKAFYRGDQSRSINIAGNVGLGLAITKEIIIDHFGNISLQDSKNLGGLLVRIKLPMSI